MPRNTGTVCSFRAVLLGWTSASLPAALWPSYEVRGIAEQLAAASGHAFTVNDDAHQGRPDVVYLYTGRLVVVGS